MDQWKIISRRFGRWGKWKFQGMQKRGCKRSRVRYFVTVSIDHAFLRSSLSMCEPPSKMPLRSSPSPLPYRFSPFCPARIGRGKSSQSNVCSVVRSFVHLVQSAKLSQRFFPFFFYFLNFLFPPGISDMFLPRECYVRLFTG